MIEGQEWLVYNGGIWNKDEVGQVLGYTTDQINEPGETYIMRNDTEDNYEFDQLTELTIKVDYESMIPMDELGVTGYSGNYEFEEAYANIFKEYYGMSAFIEWNDKVGFSIPYNQLHPCFAFNLYNSMYFNPIFLKIRTCRRFSDPLGYLTIRL